MTMLFGQWPAPAMSRAPGGRPSETLQIGHWRALQLQTSGFQAEKPPLPQPRAGTILALAMAREVSPGHPHGPKMDMPSSQNLRDQSAANDARHEVLADNTAQSVRNYLKKLFQEEAKFRSRWVWEAAAKRP